MSVYDIAIFVTDKLYNWEGFTPRDKAEEYLEGAFDQTSLHSVDITKMSNTISAPTEESQTSFNTVNPCTGNLYPYDDLAEWWYEELSCNISNDADDANLLLTNHDGEVGQAWSDWAVVSEGGPNISDLPSYTTHGYSNGGDFDSMQTALHETAHALLGAVTEHEVGRNKLHDGETYRTPMAKQNIINECDTMVGQTSYGYWTMYYSNCCYTNME